jgi:hypothetical protein
MKSFGALLAACFSAGAQNHGKLTGKVINEAGLALPNAIVVIVNNTDNTSRRVLTAADGTFTITGLSAGIVSRRS